MLDQKFRDLMAGVCAPVSVVTTADIEGPHGATVSSLASLSLRPALVSIALDRQSALLSRILRSRSPPPLGSCTSDSRSPTRQRSSQMRPETVPHPTAEPGS